MKHLSILLIAASFVTLVFAQDTKQPALGSGPIGRYQLVVGQYEGTVGGKFANPHHTIFRIDTVTGRVSRHVIGTTSNDNSEFFEYMSEIPEKGEWTGHQLKKKVQKPE
jgi:hypothetical protein